MRIGRFQKWLLFMSLLCFDVILFFYLESEVQMRNCFSFEIGKFHLVSFDIETDQLMQFYTDSEGDMSDFLSLLTLYMGTDCLTSNSKELLDKKDMVLTYKKEEYSPQVGRRSISAFIDGVWEIELDENGNQIWEGRRRKRKCTLVDDKTLEKWAATIFVGTGCSSTRGDKVTLTSYEADHTDEWALEDEKELKAQQMRKTVLMVLGVIAVVLVGFILFRVISKEIERRKRLREEELLRKQQADREQALWAAQDDANMNISMSVEESRRAELLENAINLAKEHPEDVALLIRTWLMEE